MIFLTLKDADYYDISEENIKSHNFKQRPSASKRKLNKTLYHL